MKYTVVWTPKAERRLWNIWLYASDRDVVADATNEIDRLLRIDPYVCSEEREHGRRILTVAPLGVIFRVDPGDRQVKVLAVWRFRTKSTNA
jgi:plasmid stabilization system protein ParE